MRGDRNILVVGGKEGGGPCGGGLFDVPSRGGEKEPGLQSTWCAFQCVVFFSLLDDSWLEFFYVRWCLRYSFFLP